MMKYMFILMLSFISFCFVSNKSDVDYIIISKVGASDASVSPLIISTKKLESVSYNKNKYEQELKYHMFVNVQVKESQFLHIFKYLKQTKDDVLRNEGFSEKNILIVDYRRNDGKDYQLLSFESFTGTLFFIENLYCFMKKNDFPKKATDQLIRIKHQLIKGYNAGTHFNDDVKCCFKK